MNGIEAFNNKYEVMCTKKIEKSNPEWMLDGFYNSISYKKSGSTSYVYICRVCNFLDLIKKDIKDINVDDYYRYLASLKGKSSAVQIDGYHAVQQYSKYLAARKINEDHMRNVERPRNIETQETRDKREKGYLTKEEVNILLYNAIWEDRSYKRDKTRWMGTRDYTILVIFLTTGIRCSALYKLDVDDVDIENKTITVLEKGSKSKKIYLTSECVEAISGWLYLRKKLMADYPEERALMINVRHQRMGTSAMYFVVKKLSAVIDGKNITPHKLRATYGTNLYEMTHDVYFVQKAMGHSSPKVTEIYIRGDKDNASKKASELMDGYYS